MTPKPKKPSQQHGHINAGAGLSSATKAAKATAQAGTPGGGNQPGTPAGKPGQQQGSNKPGKKPMPPKPTAPPKPEDIHHSEKSRTHIIEGEGGKQGGHIAGTGLSTKTEFPQSWKEPKIMDAAYQVTQMGPPVSGPKPTKDADGNPAWAYNYEGMVDGVLVRTTVLSTGEIRTSFPPDATNPGVILNPAAPNPAPQGVPQSTPPRYSHPDVGGNGSWTWEGPKGNRMIRVVQDAQGNVTTTDLGPYTKKK
ncbi:hypothetical protein [Lentzea nigeriaca]|uniref:hypothetical protein n=1 Tax=Lentzea nigeriaca TaxID=1128665 RepID=UPI00195725E3|nr:hypothetical protein [Lentzea nigeriaca]MBM7858884.1 hypothetical protein [Lentzea nigeriaca]